MFKTIYLKYNNDKCDFPDYTPACYPPRDLSPDEDYCTKPSPLAHLQLLRLRAPLRALGRQTAHGSKPRQYTSRQFRYQCLGAP